MDADKKGNDLSCLRPKREYLKEPIISDLFASCSKRATHNTSLLIAKLGYPTRYRGIGPAKLALERLSAWKSNKTNIINKVFCKLISKRENSDYLANAHSPFITPLSKEIVQWIDESINPLLPPLDIPCLPERPTTRWWLEQVDYRGRSLVESVASETHGIKFDYDHDEVTNEILRVHVQRSVTAVVGAPDPHRASEEGCGREPFDLKQENYGNVHLDSGALKPKRTLKLL
ncbi:hypothetical protein EVAR_11755_1 [Eumeta japonica]|uniref:Uncharacterized protein n=1 Tax=Eumeta variegata TaxID=151549 RepID=A0A4C1UQP0_EUMVA|nr:hypothetical protein EVAR_11755_1 [Eumeta japonica]